MGKATTTTTTTKPADKQMDGRADGWQLADKPKNQVDNEAGDACAQTNCLAKG